MEFPNLGEHCEEPTCNKLDFLPIACDACKKNFCNSHFQYRNHDCPKAVSKDRQVPQCPLCQASISVQPDQSADYVVSRHIDSDCKSDVALKRRIYTNKCNVKGCKKKEVVPVNCPKCLQNYCFRHRWETDHNCTGAPSRASVINKSATAALSRLAGQSTSIFKTKQKPEVTRPPSTKQSVASSRHHSQTNTQRIAATNHQQSHNHAATIQGNMSEDEALARALEASIQPTTTIDNRVLSNQEREDRELSLALQLSEQQHQRYRQSTSPNNPQPKDRSCQMM